MLSFERSFYVAIISSVCRLFVALQPRYWRQRSEALQSTNSYFNQDNKFTSLLKSFPTLNHPSIVKNPVMCHVTHHIETTGPSTYAKAHRLAPEHYQQVKPDSKFLIRQVVIRPSSSNWSSALYVFPQKNDNIRSCGDYRALNALTVMDHSPIPSIHEFSSQLNSFTIISRIDLIIPFHQIPVNPADIPKVVTITPFGLYEYVRMPFDLKNSAQNFQRFMDEVLRGLPFCFTYIDDDPYRSSWCIAWREKPTLTVLLSGTFHLSVCWVVASRSGGRRFDPLAGTFSRSWDQFLLCF